jgi:ParB family chromosome partitioning protein
LLVKLSDIKIGNRFRKDFGDITELARSIERQGLLHPIVITENNELVCGKRRIEAYSKLRKTEIEANVISLLYGLRSRELEADENIVRKNFTNAEIAEIYQFYREKEKELSHERMLAGKKPSGNFPRGRAREKIAERVGVSDRHLEKLVTVKQASEEFPELTDIWKKVGVGRMKVDKGYNQVKRFQRIRQAEELASSSLVNNWKSNSDFDLRFGDMQELGQNIPANSIDMIFTDPPYTEEFLSLYGDLAQLAERVLKPGASLVTFVGHYAIFKINDLIRLHSNLIYHWQIPVIHSGRIKRLHVYKVRACYKPLLWYYKPNLEGNGHGPTIYHDVRDIVKSKAVLKDNHEWEQSTKEAKHVIKPLTVKGNLILDPFMGSGTTGIAALELDRKFVGIEIDREHYSNATQRLDRFA